MGGSQTAADRTFGDVQGSCRKPHTEMLELVKDRDQVAEVAAEPIECCHGDEIELAAASVGHHRVAARGCR